VAPDDEETLATAADAEDDAVADVSGAAVKRIIVDGGKEVVAVEDALLMDVADADESEEGVGVP
jgi:hypothetical protein